MRDGERRRWLKERERASEGEEARDEPSARRGNVRARRSRSACSSPCTPRELAAALLAQHRDSVERAHDPLSHRRALDPVALALAPRLDLHSSRPHSHNNRTAAFHLDYIQVR